jgi:hypothetical protein
VFEFTSSCYLCSYLFHATEEIIRIYQSLILVINKVIKRDAPTHEEANVKAKRIRNETLLVVVVVGVLLLASGIFLMYVQITQVGVIFSIIAVILEVTAIIGSIHLYNFE